MDSLAQDHFSQLMEAIKDLCDAVGNQASADVKARITDLQTDVNNFNEPRPEA